MNSRDKRAVNCIASVGIIFPEHDPTKLFLELKDETFPIKVFRNFLCFIGGSWIGEKCADRDTAETFERELNEEISFERPAQNTDELKLLGWEEVPDRHRTSLPPLRAPTAEEIAWLDKFKEMVKVVRQPFADFILTIPHAVFASADPATTRETTATLCSYWEVPLPTELWRQLEAIQGEFGNLSTESRTIITTVDEIMRSQAKFMAGHDQVLREFLRARRSAHADELPIFDGISVERVGEMFTSYDDYLRVYDIAKHPSFRSPA